jgi:rhodanese-related sulfurtransferase
VVDVRDPEAFETAHLIGSMNIGLQGNFATWAGTVLAQDTPIVLIAAPGQEAEAAMRLGRIGFDHVIGYLADGPQSLEARPDLVRRITRITATELATALGGMQPPLVLDVRGPGERAVKHIDGSLHIPLPRLASQLHTLPRDRTVVLQCAGGYRSAIAASILARHRMTEIADLVGGLAAWEAAGLGLAATLAS